MAIDIHPPGSAPAADNSINSMRVVLLTFILLLLLPLAGHAQDADESDPDPKSREEAELDRAAEALSGFLDRIKGFADELPDRTLRGTVKLTRTRNERTPTGFRNMYCLAFGGLTLKPQSLKSYPRGQWGAAEGLIVVQTRSYSEHHHKHYGKSWFAWEGAAPAGASVAISALGEGTYQIHFSSSNIPTRQRQQREGGPVEEYEGHQCAASVTVENLPLPDPDEPFAGTHYDHDANISLSWDFRRNPCKRNEVPPDPFYEPPPAPTGEAEVLQQALIRALNRRSVPVGARHVNAYSDHGLLNFYFRISRDKCILPTASEISSYECLEEASQIGASHLAMGAIQQVGGSTRATIRMVVVETARIIDAGRGDAEGTGGEAIERALTRALEDMDYKFSCVGEVEK